MYVVFHLRLKEEIKTIECKMSSLTVDLRRREDDSSDLREKLGDSKKQIQQVQKEVRTHSSLIQTSLLSGLKRVRAELELNLTVADLC